MLGEITTCRENFEMGSFEAAWSGGRKWDRAEGGERELPEGSAAENQVFCALHLAELSFLCVSLTLGMWCDLI